MQLIAQEEVIGLAFAADDNIEPINIRPARIEIAQLRYIKPVFGNKMYRSMILQKYDDFVAEYIKPALAHFIRYELIGELAIRASDMGVGKPQSEEVNTNSRTTKNDEQNRTDTTREESNKLQVTENTTTSTNTQNTSQKNTEKNTKEESTINQGNDQETINSTESDKTTAQKTISEQVDASIAVTLTEESETNQENLNKETLTKNIISRETATQATQTVTEEAEHEVKSSDEKTINENQEMNNLATKNLSVETAARSENQENAESTKVAKIAASAAEWQLLARQALRDARTFLRYAVEYVELNRNSFPDYEPATGRDAVARRKCIGGIIL